MCFNPNIDDTDLIRKKNMENKEQEIIKLLKQVILLKREAKESAASFREDIKELETQIADLVEQASDPK